MTAEFNPVVLMHQVGGVVFLPPLLFIWLGLLGVFLRRRTLVLLALFACYASATPQLALWLARPLEPASIATQDRLTQIDAIVVLGGGSRWGPEYGSDQLGAESLGRLNYAATLARRSGKPLLLSGGAPLGGEPEARVMMRTLQENAALSARWIEPRSNTTAENARESARLLLPQGIRRIALVTSAWHERRAVADFERQGFVVLPAPTGFVSYPGPVWLRFLPHGAAMQQTYSASREWLAIASYQLGRHLP
jgi:uncharacterized SAM-binding protein YcdF (DUF218 family)